MPCWGSFKNAGNAENAESAEKEWTASVFRSRAFSAIPAFPASHIPIAAFSSGVAFQ